MADRRRVTLFKQRKALDERQRDETFKEHLVGLAAPEGTSPPGCTLIPRQTGSDIRSYLGKKKKKKSVHLM